MILLVEDDKNLADSLKSYLASEGLDVEVVEGLKSALKCEPVKYQLILLDWMLPDGQGIDFLRKIRESKSNVPVILLTAKADLVDRVLGLESGANDYIVKPFEPRELLARMRVQLRGSLKESSPFMRSGLKIDFETRQVTFLNQELDLTKKEFELLALLSSSPNKVFSRDELLNKVWGFENFPTTRTVDTHILQLRQKIKDEFFETVRGVGYRMRLDQELTRS